MRRTSHYIGLALALSALGQVPLTAQDSFTIYNDGRVLARRTVTADIGRGQSTLRLPLGQLDPATLFSVDTAVTITSLQYDAATDVQSVLRRAIGRKLKFRWGSLNDTVTATVLGVDPERYLLPDGSVTFSMPGTPLFPADLVVVEPVANLSIRASAARNALRLGYFTGGASWQANYEILLGRSQATVMGDATITSDRLNAENAEVQLLAGSVAKAVRPYEGVRDQVMMAARAEAREAPSEQRVGDFHLYTLPGRITLRPGLSTSIALFDPVRTGYERNYVVPGALPWYGILPQFPEPEEPPVEISYTIRRPPRSEFGQRALPGGVARLYEPDSAGRLQLVGEAALGHTAPGEDLRLNAGVAFDITARRVQTSYSTRRDSLRTIATADYSVTLKNATESAVTVDVMERRPGEWSVVSSSVPAEKLSSTQVRFRVAVPAGGERVLTYRLRVVW